MFLFLSTPPSRVATAVKTAMRGQPLTVSIHATLAGGDFQNSHPVQSAVMFLSTPPSRVATNDFKLILNHSQPFLSTPPSRVATGIDVDMANGINVSIHATLAGGDHLALILSKIVWSVSIHATLAGGDVKRYRT